MRTQGSGHAEPSAERTAVNFKEKVEEYERALIVGALRETGGNQRRAARLLGVLPTTLNEKMKRLGLRVAHAQPAYLAQAPQPGPGAASG